MHIFFLRPHYKFLNRVYLFINLPLITILYFGLPCVSFLEREAVVERLSNSLWSTELSGNIYVLDNRLMVDNLINR